MKLGLLVSSERKNVQKGSTLENIWTEQQYKSEDIISLCSWKTLVLVVFNISGLRESLFYMMRQQNTETLF